MRHAGILLLLVLLLPSASAHAVLQSADPPPNGQVPEGVTRVTFRFTEDVEREYTNADLLDLQGESWAAGPIEFDAKEGNVIHLPVRPLVSGLYSASWKALSVDTHTTRGTFVFAVGNATLRPGQYEPIVDVPSDADVARDAFPRFAFFLGLFLAGGMPLFALVVLREPPARSLFLVAAAFGAVGAVGALLSLVFLGERIGADLAGALGTGPGRSFLLRGGLLAGAAIAAGWGAAVPARWRAAALGASALAAAACVATSLGSHAAAVRGMTPLFIAADAAHLLAGLAWVGGIAGFLHVLAGRTHEEVSRLVFRFGSLAVPSVALLLATGTLASFAHMPCFAEGGAPACAATLREDRYAQLVLLKLLLMAPLIALGALNKYAVGPRLARGVWTPARFRRIVAAEAAIMLVIVGAAGGLAASSPPASEAEQGPPPLAAVWEEDNFTEKSHVILQISPNPVTVGIQRVVVVVHPLGPQLPNGTIVQLKVWKEGEREPDVNRDLPQVTPNEWEIEEGVFTSAGTWNVVVVLQRPDEFAKPAFQVEVVNPGQSS